MTTITGVCKNGVSVSISGTGLISAVDVMCVSNFYSRQVSLSSGDGAKAITARQTDMAGNVATVNLNLNKDTQAPVVTITSPAAGTKAEAGLTLQGACETGLPVKLSGAGIDSDVSATCANQKYSATITFSAGDGHKTISVSQTDAATNTGSVSRQFEKGSMIDPAANYAGARSVLNQYCTSCHGPGGQASYADFTLNESSLVLNGFVAAGKPDQSKLIVRLLRYAGATAGGARNMPLGGSTASFPASAYDTLVKWVKEMSPPVAPPTPSGFTCTTPSARAPSVSYTLTKTQYINTLTDLFGATTVSLANEDLGTISADTFDAMTNARTTTISAATYQAYFVIGKIIGNAVLADTAKTTTVFGSCANAAAPTASCINTYLNGFARKIFRRPLTTDEVAFATQLANRGGDYKTNLRTVLLLHLTSQPFLWRLELGSSANGSLITLTPYEVASRISYLAADTTPDDTLMKAAANNQLANTAQVQSHVRRLLLTANGKAKTQKNLMRYSLNDRVADFTALPASLKSGKNLTGLGQAMVDETSQFISYSLYTQNVSFKTLLTSNVSLASNPTLASIYGHTAVSPGGTAIMSGRRQGLLMRSPFFAISNSRTSIIKRGANFQRRLLCNDIPLPGKDVVDIRDEAAFTPSEQLLHSNREVIAQQTSPQLCMSCHSKINATGFAFENLGPFGELRTQEPIFDVDKNLLRTVAVYTDSAVPMPSGETVPVSDGFDLISHVATSQEGTSCFVRNAFRFINEREELSADNCQLNNVHKDVLDQSKSVVDALVDLIANDALFAKQN